MEKILGKLQPYLIPILSVLCAVLVVIVIVLSYLYKNSIEKEAETTLLLNVSQNNLVVANKHITEQNEKIKALELTPEQKEKLENNIEHVIVEYRDKIVYVEKELTKDNSCENQLRVLQNILKDFSNETL